jgi:hypothetical protein
MKSKEELDHLYFIILIFIHIVTFMGGVKNYRYHNNFFSSKKYVNCKYNEVIVSYIIFIS